MAKDDDDPVGSWDRHAFYTARRTSKAKTARHTSHPRVRYSNPMPLPPRDDEDENGWYPEPWGDR